MQQGHEGEEAKEISERFNEWRVENKSVQTSETARSVMNQVYLFARTLIR